MWIKTLPVSTKLAAPADIPQALRTRVPNGWELYGHQVDTYRALTEGEADVVVNVAMTGDGKSLASQLPCLATGNWSMMAMYPTNELIADQSRQVDKALETWQRHTLNVAQLDASRLDELIDQTGLLRRDALLGIFQNNPIVLSNPDIFHYIMQQYYIRTGKHGDNPDYLIGHLLNNFKQFTFDEFHVFRAPEAVSVTNALLFIHEITGKAHRKRFLFLSATPQDKLAEYLEKGGLQVVRVHGSYTHGSHAPEQEGWRRILHGTTLNFVPQRAEEWVEGHLEDVLIPFFLSHRPASKGAIIVNSVAAALRLVERLRPALQKHGLTVRSNTGFDARLTRRASYDADLLVATSTVDVGVDFQINFLVFESRDAGTFLQRLGRLGRHDGFERDGTYHRFEAFEAHALVPSWVQERLFQTEVGKVPRLIEGQELDRESLSQTVQDAFPPFATFERYRSAWGGLQAAYILRGLAHPRIRATYEESRKRLLARYNHTLGVSVQRELGRLREVMENERPILEEVRSFRGGGDLLCGVIDEKESGPARVKTYDLFHLLTNFELDSLAEEDFFQEVKRWGLSGDAFRRDDLLGYVRVFGVRPERQDVTIYFGHDVGDWSVDRYGKVQVIKGVEILAEGKSYLSQLNHGLRQRKSVALIMRSRPAELVRRLRLPSPFPLYKFVSRDNVEGAIAFGRQALLLYVALLDSRCIKSGAEEKPVIS
jgi:CRISPR-associated endonuclease/helicase Cas3